MLIKSNKPVKSKEKAYIATSLETRPLPLQHSVLLGLTTLLVATEWPTDAECMS